MSDCRRCRHYRAEHERKDPLFGRITITDWCIVRRGRVEDRKGCLMFLPRIFDHDQE